MIRIHELLTDMPFPWLVYLQILVLYALMPVPVSAQLILGVHPYLDTQTLQLHFAPLASYLSQRLGEEVVIKVGISYEEHILAIGTDRLDIAFLGPASYVALVERFGPKPLLARLELRGKSTFFGDILVRSDSPLRTLGDLKGRVFAFGDPNSTMSHILPEYMLRRAGVTKHDLHHFMYLPSHDDVALAVLMGDADAGAVKHEVVAHYVPRGLRSIAQTPRISEHLFVTRSDMSASQVETIRQTLMSLHDW